MDIVIASRNLHKIREFKEMLKGTMGFELYSLRDFPDYVPPPEDGETFEENATVKAVHAAKALSMAAIGDDSGLVVSALGGRPGIYSARFAGEGATDADNRKKLLEDLVEFTGEKRSAYFECSLAVAQPSGEVKAVRGILEGRIIENERGGNGFGYDPLFMKNDYNKTLAELENSVKNRISHRRRALDKLQLYLEGLTTAVSS